MTPWPEPLRAWSAMLHAREPATTIALFRILFGLLLLTNALLFAREARLWIGPRGVLPRGRYREAFGRSRFTLLSCLPDTEVWLLVVMGIHLLAVAALTLGFATRTSAAVVFLTLLSIQHRNPLVLYGADHVMRLMSFLLIFSRAGEAWSVDHWLAAGAGQPVLEGTAWCSRLMQMQVSIVYFKAFVSKLAGSTWREGTAVYYAVEGEAFRRWRLPRFMRGSLASRALTWCTLAVEFGLGSLVWVGPLRYPILVAGAALHLGMEAFMNLQLFGATMVVCLTLFIDPQALDALLQRLGTP
jgi:uncharacterized membrane protein YphA (DoxX/SURF4 family)